MQGVAASVSDTLGNIKPWLQRVANQNRTSDSKYFSTNKRGENFELKADLNSERKDKKKEAVKKVIASMTVGKDVSSLFPDVINCMQTDNLELKKLVYLYLMNYAKSQQDNAIMAVNTFVKDCEDPNPLIRALAVRTMGCIRVAKMTAYHLDPLRKCLKDDDPYVRKTAAVCVAKLYDIDPELVEESEFLVGLKDLISDSNPMVVANAVASITEILDKTDSSYAMKTLAFDQAVINKLLTALNECSEWGQIFILDAVAEYSPANEKEAESIVERVLPRLAHANAAVVLSTVKVIMKMLELIEQNSDLINVVTNKLAPPLVTLLSAEPEIQYVALRNISLIIQKRKSILKNEMKVFFVKYNDPIYVKLEKLDIMIRLTNQSNIVQVLAELKEYAKEVDVDFVRKSVRAIGRCAIKVESSAERCVTTLIELIQTKVNYVVQEAIVVIKDIFRKYPNKYESIIATLCENLDTLDESEARASMIWIIGEYAERIDNADELLESFLTNFKDENIQVQLQLLTAIVKLFLKRPTETRELVQNVLSLATQNSDNPDLRDRGYIYWRLLSTDPEAAKKVVLAEKPLISEETDLIEPTLLDELICNLASLASVYHKPPSTFVDSKHLGKKLLLRKNEGDNDNRTNGAMPSVIPQQQDMIGDLLNLDVSPVMVSNNGHNYGLESMNQQPDLLGDGLDDLITDRNENLSSGVAVKTNTVDALADIFNDFSTENSPAKSQKSYKPPTEIWLDKARGKGLEIKGTFFRSDVGVLTMELTFTNNALMPMSDFAIQFNKNSFGIIPTQTLNVPSPLSAGQTATTTISLGTHGPLQKMNPLMNLQVAVKNNIDVLYFACIVPINILFTNEGNMDKIVFLETWKEIPQENEKRYKIVDMPHTPDDCIHLLQLNHIFNIQRTTCEGHDMLFQAMQLTNKIWILVEMRFNAGGCEFSLKSRAVDVYPAVKTVYEGILGISCVEV